MIRRPVATITALILGLGLGVGGVGAPVVTSTATAATTPPSFGAVTATPGPGIGEVTFKWTHTGANTTGYRVETGLTSFSTTDSSLPVHARGYKYFTFPANVRTYTLSAAQVASAGAAVGSGNHLYYRFNATNSGTNKFWPYLQQVAVKPAVPAATGTALRVGTFNIRTARATTDNQTWLQRVPAVAASIKAYNPGVLGLQELGPGRADGQTGTTGGTPRQTDSLVTELTKQGAGKYKLVRTTPYVAPGVATATQGMRILYDTTKYSLVSPCVDKTGTSSYSSSCSISLPIRGSGSGDDENDRLRAAYAEFVDTSTGAHFYYLSVHLDARSSSNATTDKTFDALRGAQAKTAIDAVAKLNTRGYPVVLGGDLNTWQNDKAGYTGHDVMVTAGYYDTAAAATQVKSNWTTMNHFDTTIASPGAGFGSRLDAVLVKGVRGAVRWENVFENPDSLRPSDHNMVIADIRLPSQAPASSDYAALNPVRLLDTRSGLGAAKALVPASGEVDLVVTGRGGVPLTGVSAVVLNVTVTQPATGGYATVFPAGVARPNASTLNFPAAKTIANSVIVQVGTGGKVSLYASAATHLLADVQGWFPTGSSLNSQTPARILDTRDGTGAPVSAVSAGGSVELTVAGTGGVPANGAGSVVLNVTATQGSKAGYTTVYPSGAARPEAYTVSYATGGTVAGGTVAKIGANGKVTLYASAGVHLIVDVQGWFPTAGDVTAVTPARLLDTRATSAGQVPAGGTVDVTVLGTGGVPLTGVSAVVLTVTATAGSGGYITAYPAGVTRPIVSTLNPSAGETIGNSVVVKVGTGGKVTLYAHGATHLVAEVSAYIK